MKQMLDILKLLGKYEGAVLEGEKLAIRVLEKRATDIHFRNSNSLFSLLRTMNEANCKFKNEEFILFLRQVYSLVNQPLPIALEWLFIRNEADSASILSGFTMLFMLTLGQAVTEEDEV